MRIAIIVLFLFPFNVFAQDIAFEFLKTLNKEFTFLQSLQVDYLGNMVHRHGDALEEKNIELQNAVKSAVSKIEALETLPNDNGLKKAALETFLDMDNMTKSDFKEIIMKKVGCIDCFAAEEYKFQLVNEESEKVNRSFSKLQKRIENFAKENNIQLLDSKNEFEIIIAKVNRINDYLQLIDLSLAQAHYASETVIKNFNSENFKAAQESIKTMKKEMKEAFKRFKKIEPINEDAFCLKKADILLSFYQKMADEVFPEMLGAFNKKGEIDNNGIKIFNKNIETINRQLPQKKEAYQQMKSELLMKNVPKPAKEFKG